MDLNAGGVRRRRRGEELENALLDAAWDLLNEHGYDAFTIDAVATRAGTSRPVIYRRWPGKHELVRAAIGYGEAKSRPLTPNTGTLRGDVIALLKQTNATRIGLATLFSIHLGAYYDETGTSMSDLREVLLAGHSPASDQIIARGLGRGEIDPAKLTPRIMRLPFDLFRQEVLMTFKPMADDAIEEIIDTIFLPLVTPDPAAS